MSIIAFPSMAARWHPAIRVVGKVWSDRGVINAVNLLQFDPSNGTVYPGPSSVPFPLHCTPFCASAVSWRSLQSVCIFVNNLRVVIVISYQSQTTETSHCTSRYVTLTRRDNDLANQDRRLEFEVDDGSRRSIDCRNEKDWRDERV